MRLQANEESRQSRTVWGARRDGRETAEGRGDAATRKILAHNKKKKTLTLGYDIFGIW